jgi:hypothetical protein
MSINTNKNSRFRTVNAQADTTLQEETAYKCPANCRAMVELLFIKNVSSGNATVDVELNRNDSVTDNGTGQGNAAHMHILGGKNMATGEFIQFADGFIVLEPEDTITITATGTGTIHVDVMVTVEEFFLPVGG